MEQRAGGASNPRGNKGGRGRPLPAGPSARQLLARLDARPLAARAAADVSAMVRRAGATLRLRAKEAVGESDSADIEVTDRRLPHVTVAEHRPQVASALRGKQFDSGLAHQCISVSLFQHRRSETISPRTVPLPVTQGKGHCAWKPAQASDQFSVELLRGSAGFGLTLSGGRDVGGDAALVVSALLKDGPAQRCGLLQPGDLVLQVNGESTQGLSHGQVVERIRAGGPRLSLVLCRPLEMQPQKAEGTAKPHKGGGPSLVPGVPKVMRSHGSTSVSPVQQPRFSTTSKTQRSPEPSPQATADCPAMPPPRERRCSDDPDDHVPGSPGPWLVPSEERLSQALGAPGPGQLAQEVAAGRRRH
ncbi:PDZ domain-containing protein MAGIX isoform X1 [Ochotona princeps]|uniref:PDZ domain-containing protein MAGIX isoform X1 n=1 Tax=Ochotona princeps TaxID=9978 RepID=UPI002714D04B|nr:PDZ domain-containing protein MAGIX isoform X1 [Ochotona princeps]